MSINTNHIINMVYIEVNEEFHLIALPPVYDMGEQNYKSRRSILFTPVIDGEHSVAVVLKTVFDESSCMTEDDYILSITIEILNWYRSRE